MRFMERTNIIERFVMWYLHTQYKKYGMPTFYIRGTDEDYPKYLLYTENEVMYQRFDKV